MSWLRLAQHPLHHPLFLLPPAPRHQVKLLRELRHPNILQLIDVFIGEGEGGGGGCEDGSCQRKFHLVLEKCAGDLEGLIQDKERVRFANAHVKAYLQMLLAGLHHCHRNYVLHRDLKVSMGS